MEGITRKRWFEAERFQNRVGRYMAGCSTNLETINIENEAFKRIEQIYSNTYIGAVLHETGYIDSDVNSRISAAWPKWRELTAHGCHLDHKNYQTRYGWLIIYKIIIAQQQQGLVGVNKTCSRSPRQRNAVVDMRRYSTRQKS